MEEYYENEPRFIGVYFRDNLPKIIKSGAYVINLDEYADVGTHWIALYVKNNEVIYFDSFGVEHVPKEVKRLVANKDIKIYIQDTSRQLNITWLFLCFIHRFYGCK